VKQIETVDFWIAAGLLATLPSRMKEPNHESS